MHILLTDPHRKERLHPIRVRESFSTPYASFSTTQRGETYLLSVSGALCVGLCQWGGIVLFTNPFLDADVDVYDYNDPRSVVELMSTLPTWKSVTCRSHPLLLSAGFKTEDADSVRMTRRLYSRLSK